jgi:hypothetical protein
MRGKLTFRIEQDGPAHPFHHRCRIMFVCCCVRSSRPLGEERDKAGDLSTTQVNEGQGGGEVWPSDCRLPVGISAIFARGRVDQPKAILIQPPHWTAPLRLRLRSDSFTLLSVFKAVFEFDGMNGQEIIRRSCPISDKLFLLSSSSVFL